MKSIAIAVLLSSVPVVATAQTAAGAEPAAGRGVGGLLGQAGGLLGGGVPAVGSIGAGNAAGLLGYCVKNKLLGATGGASGASGVLGRLTGQKDVKTSPGYIAGQAGQVQAPDGQTLSLGSLRGQVKNQLCNLVLSRARSFL